MWTLRLAGGWRIGGDETGLDDSKHKSLCLSRKSLTEGVSLNDTNNNK